MENNIAKAHARFELNIPAAMLDQLVKTLENLQPIALSEIEREDLPNGAGVYQLIHKKQIVYTGKSDGNIVHRLQRHRLALSGRRNIAVKDITFRYITLSDFWDPVIPETSLIDHFVKDESVSWNRTGYGSNDPGRNREMTEVNSFDLQHPVDSSFKLATLKSGEYSVNEYLQWIKKELPYTFRYYTDNPKSWQTGSKMYNDLRIKHDAAQVTASSVIVNVARQLQEGTGKPWQATALPPRIILYPEEGIEYPQGEVLYP